MAYRIEYGGAEFKAKTARGKGRQWVMTAVFFLLFLLLVKAHWPAGMDKLNSLLIPGGEKNRTAFQEMVNDIHSGSGAGEAFTTFCRQVIENAQES